MYIPKHTRMPRGAQVEELPRIQSPARPFQAGDHAPAREVL